MIDTSNHYLTDEQLNMLIEEIESCELVCAPPDTLDRIINRIEYKKKEFRLYKFKVIAATIAAILLLGVFPSVLSSKGDLANIIGFSHTQVQFHEQSKVQSQTKSENRRIINYLQRDTIFNDNLNLGLFNKSED